MFASLKRATLLGPLSAVMLLGGLLSAATAQEEPVEYTGCLTPGGDITNVAIGDAPLKDCKGNSIEIHWNEIGPPGEQGPQGIQGEQGPSGPGAPDPGRVILNSSDFIPDGATVWRDMVSPPQNGDLGFAHAAVHLPQGATITRFSILGIDDTGGADCYFQAWLMATETTLSTNPDLTRYLMASVDSTDSDIDGPREISDSSILLPVVDNTEWMYNLELRMTNSSPPGTSVWVYRAVVEYTLP